jgi:hypothetical protein
MVQVLPGIESFGERMGKNLGGGLNQGIEALLQDAMKRKKLQETYAQKLGLQQRKEAHDFAKIEKQENLKNKLKKEFLVDKMNLIGSLLGDEEMIPKTEETKSTPLSGEEIPTERKKEAFEPLNISDKKIAEITALDPSTGNALRGLKDTALREQQSQKKMTQNERHFAHTQTSDYAKDLRENAKKSEEVISGVREIRKRIQKEGSVGPNARNLAFTYFQSKESPFANLFQTEDTQAIMSATKSLAGGSFKDLFGGRGTQREFFWFTNILPDILKDAATNEASLKYFEKIALTNLKRKEIADKIITKNGGFRPIDLETRVSKKMQKEMDKLVTEGEKIYETKLLEDAPDPSKNEGRTIVDELGNRFISTGSKWEKL